MGGISHSSHNRLFPHGEKLSLCKCGGRRWYRREWGKGRDREGHMGWETVVKTNQPISCISPTKEEFFHLQTEVWCLPARVGYNLGSPFWGVCLFAPCWVHFYFHEKLAEYLNNAFPALLVFKSTQKKDPFFKG